MVLAAVGVMAYLSLPQSENPGFMIRTAPILGVVPTLYAIFFRVSVRDFRYEGLK